MATTLPTYSRTVDDLFMSILTDLSGELMNNIIGAVPIWKLLNARGCLKPQAGGDYIVRPITYGEVAAVAINENSVLPEGIPDLDTGAMWTWRALGVHVQRNIIQDAKNYGRFRIRNLVNRRLEAARDGLEQKFESCLVAAAVLAETGDEPQGINDIVPAVTSYTTWPTTTNGTWGKINRPTAYAQSAARGNCYIPSAGNTWWGNVYRPITLPVEIYLVDDMKTLFNTIKNGLQAPNLIVANQTLCEMYEAFGVEGSQIAKLASPQGLDLGFDALMFKGAPILQSNDVMVSDTNQMLMLNTNFLEIVYNPVLWFTPTDWKGEPKQLDKLMHILCMFNTVSNQPRRHGRLYGS